MEFKAPKKTPYGGYMMRSRCEASVARAIDIHIPTVNWAYEPESTNIVDHHKQWWSPDFILIDRFYDHRLLQLIMDYKPGYLSPAAQTDTEERFNRVHTKLGKQAIPLQYMVFTGNPGSELAKGYTASMYDPISKLWYSPEEEIIVFTNKLADALEKEKNYRWDITEKITPEQARTVHVYDPNKSPPVPSAPWDDAW